MHLLTAVGFFRVLHWTNSARHMDSKKPLSIDRTDYPGNHETTPYVDVDAQPRAFLTLCEPGDVSQLTQVPADSFAAESGYEYALSSASVDFSPLLSHSSLLIRTILHPQADGSTDINHFGLQAPCSSKPNASPVLPKYRDGTNRSRQS